MGYEDVVDFKVGMDSYASLSFVRSDLSFYHYGVSFSFKTTFTYVPPYNSDEMDLLLV